MGWRNPPFVSVGLFKVDEDSERYFFNCGSSQASGELRGLYS